jgi:hypothetical protein
MAVTTTMEVPQNNEAPAPEVTPAAPAAAPAETPSAAPAAEPTAATPAASESDASAPAAEGTELYELPDGRKVDGQTLVREWKQNFLPDYTRKSQELAQIKNPAPQNSPQAPDWRDPNWQPQTYAELIELAKVEVQRDFERKQQEDAQRIAAVDAVVQGQLDEIKKLEPNLSEELLFQHANRYQFSNLMAAFQNMKDMNKAVKLTEARVVQNMKTREAAPIAAQPGSGNAAEQGIDLNSVRGVSAVEYLQRIKK